MGYIAQPIMGSYWLEVVSDDGKYGYGSGLTPNEADDLIAKLEAEDRAFFANLSADDSLAF